MSSLYYVMAIMGCADGEQACAEARIEPAHYASIGACQAAMPRALARNTNMDFPVISATCREAGMRIADRARADRRTRG